MLSQEIPSSANDINTPHVLDNFSVALKKPFSIFKHIEFQTHRNGKPICFEEKRKQFYERQKLETRITQLLRPDQRTLVDTLRITSGVERNLPLVMKTSALDAILAEATAKLAIIHPVYDAVAAQLELDCIMRATPIRFSEACQQLAAHPNSILTQDFMAHLAANQDYLDIMVAGARHPDYSYSSVLYMKGNILLHRNGTLVERPEYAFMRVAIALHGSDPVLVMSTFEQLLNRQYVHSPTTMIQAGTVRGNLNGSHMMRLALPTSPLSAFSALHQAAAIRAAGGSISVNFTNIPSVGADIAGVPALGVPPLLSLYNTAAAVSVCDSNRKLGRVTAFLEVWHQDVYAVLEAIEGETSANHLHYGLSIPNIFMLRAQKNMAWSLFSPQDVPLLQNSFGVAFDAAFFAYEMDLRIPRTAVPARSVLSAIVRCQLKVGEPMIIYKDHSSLKSNQLNIGMISQADAFGAVTQCATPTEAATASEGALILPSFLRNGKIEYEELMRATHALTINLNRVLDLSTPATIEVHNGGGRRSIAIGIQGLGECLLLMKLSYSSPDAKRIMSRVVKAINFSAALASILYSRNHGAYGHFGGSPMANGIIVHNLHGQPDDNDHDWAKLKQDAATYGTANSVFTALIPMDAMSNIAGLDTTTGPIKSVIRNIDGYAMIHPTLVRWLSDLNMWTEEICVLIVRGRGSVQHIQQIPRLIREVFKTSWELGPEAIVDMAIVAAPYICGAQSLSLCVENPSLDRIMGLHFKSWSAGLKAGLYSLETRDASAAAPDLKDTQTGIPSIRICRSASSISSNVPLVTTLAIDFPIDGSNSSETDEIDMYATESEEADCEDNCDSDRDADGENDPDYEVDSKSDVDELMLDSVDAEGVDNDSFEIVQDTA